MRETPYNRLLMIRRTLFGWLLIAAAILTVIAAQSLIGCVSVPERTVRLAWTDCAGTARDVQVEVRRAAFPPAACVALAAEHVGPLSAAWVFLQTQMACTMVRSDYQAAIMILPPDGSFATHEFSRLIDMDPSAPRPWGELPRDCQIAREQ